MFLKGVPADTSTTAEKSLISSSLSCRTVSFSLNSNIQLSSSPAPMERSRSTLYFLPLRNLTVRSFTSNNDTKRTISTCMEETEESVRGLTDACAVCNASGLVLLYLEGSCLEEVDLVVLGKVLEARDPLGKFHHFSYGRDEALGKLLPDFMTGLAGVHEGGNAHGTHLREDQQSPITPGTLSESLKIASFVHSTQWLF